VARRPAESAASSQDTYPGWEDVYADNVGWMYRMLYRSVGNRQDAEDLTTDVFLAALRPLDITATRPEVRAYLKLTAQTVLARHWRRHYKLEITQLPDDVPLPAVDDDADRPPEVGRATDIIATLSGRYRTVLELRFLHGMSVKDVAETMGVSVGNAKVLQHRALTAAARSAQSL
jgi:RNA polymerase sigma factor (sigma-70 family)